VNISLTDSLESFVQDKVASGDYKTASEVVREGLRLLRDRDQDRLASLKKDIALALSQLDRGEGRPVDEISADC
jgi:antitoxin ParD1/3/4